MAIDEGKVKVSRPYKELGKKDLRIIANETGVVIREDTKVGAKGDPKVTWGWGQVLSADSGPKAKALKISVQVDGKKKEYEFTMPDKAKAKSVAAAITDWTSAPPDPGDEAPPPGLPGFEDLPPDDGFGDLPPDGFGDPPPDGFGDLPPDGFGDCTADRYSTIARHFPCTIQ